MGKHDRSILDDEYAKHTVRCGIVVVDIAKDKFTVQSAPDGVEVIVNDLEGMRRADRAKPHDLLLGALGGRYRFPTRKAAKTARALARKILQDCNLDMELTIELAEED